MQQPCKHRCQKKDGKVLEQRFLCSLRERPCQSRYPTLQQVDIPGRKLQPVEVPQWSWFILSQPVCEGHTLEQLVLIQTVLPGEPMLGQAYSEGLWFAERIHARAVCEGLQPIPRTHTVAGENVRRKKQQRSCHRPTATPPFLNPLYCSGQRRRQSSQ